LLFQSVTGNLDHVALYVGDNMILNHNIHKLSCKEPLDMAYLQNLRGVYRYEP
jgi:cell wall-associated NlpC family hydrolase